MNDSNGPHVLQNFLAEWTLLVLLYNRTKLCRFFVCATPIKMLCVSHQFYSQGHASKRLSHLVINSMCTKDI